MVITADAGIMNHRHPAEKHLVVDQPILFCVDLFLAGAREKFKY
jgi:hypothetical protein